MESKHILTGGWYCLAQDNPYDLVRIIEANQSAKKHQLDIMPRIKVAFKCSDIKQRIIELDAATNTLYTFSQTILMNRHSPFNSIPSSNNIKLAKAFRQIQKFSKNLYTALCCCCVGTCHNEHDVHVLLEDRIDVAYKLLQYDSTLKLNEEDEALLAFQLIFAARLLAPIQTRWHELSVTCIHEEENPDHSQSLASNLQQVQVSEPALAKSKHTDRLVPKFVPIDDFCAAIITAHEKAQHIAFVLHESNRMGLITAKEKTIMQRNSCQRITLKEVLSVTSSSHGVKLPLRSAMLLASKLASSLLQFSRTRWFDQTWSKDSIYFLLHPISEGIEPLVDFTRPFVYAKIEGTEVNGEKMAEPRSILLEFGILLLEIWHQITLENWSVHRKGEMSINDSSLLSLADAWLHDNYNTPPLLYEDAIRYCVYGVSTKRGADWDKNELWSEICKEVVKPLSENCKQWR